MPSDERDDATHSIRSLDRRDFLKLGALGGAAAVTVGASGCGSPGGPGCGPEELSFGSARIDGPISRCPAGLCPALQASKQPDFRRSAAARLALA